MADFGRVPPGGSRIPEADRRVSEPVNASAGRQRRDVVRSGRCRFGVIRRIWAMVNLYCCQRLASDLAHTCAVHPDRTDCPDAFIAEMNGGFGLMIHDGGSSAVEIAFCPWCGAALSPMEH